MLLVDGTDAAARLVGAHCMRNSKRAFGQATAQGSNAATSTAELPLHPDPRAADELIG